MPYMKLACKVTPIPTIAQKFDRKKLIFPYNRLFLFDYQVAQYSPFITFTYAFFARNVSSTKKIATFCLIFFSLYKIIANFAAQYAEPMKRNYLFLAFIYCLTFLNYGYTVSAQNCCPVVERKGSLDQFLYEMDNVQIDTYTTVDDDYWMQYNGYDPITGVAIPPSDWIYNKFIRIRAWSSRSANKHNYIQMFFWCGSTTAGKTQQYANCLGPKAGIYEVSALNIAKYINYNTSYSIYSWTSTVLPPSDKPMLLGYATHSFWNEDKGSVWVCPVSSYCSTYGGPALDPHYYYNYGCTEYITTFNKAEILVGEGEGGKLYIEINEKDCGETLVTIGRKVNTDVFRLNTSTVGNGTLHVSPDCEMHITDEEITLTPVPNDANTCFRGWTGADATLVKNNGDGTYSLTMLDREMTVVANFADCGKEANEALTICECELPFLWNGIECTAAGTYDYTCKAADGETDSTTHLTLTVQIPTIRTLTAVSTCDDTPYSWRGHAKFQNLTTSGLYTDTTQYYTTLSSTGMRCPRTIYPLQLTVNQTYNNEQTLTICDTEVDALWAEHTFAQAKPAKSNTTITMDAVEARKTQYTNCDSTITYHLTIHPSYAVTEPVTVCENQLHLAEPYKWNGITITGTGDNGKQVTLKTVKDCDSIVTLALTVLPAQTYYDSVHVCSFPYVWHYKSHTETILSEADLYVNGGTQGVYTTTSAQGCEENTYMVAKTITISTDNSAQTVCENELNNLSEGWSYTFTSGTAAAHTVIVKDTLPSRRTGDNTYTYKDTVRTVSDGCDSAYYTLSLRVVRPVTMTPDTILQCGNVFEGQSWFIPGFTEHNNNEDFELLSDFGTYRDTMRTANGCDSIYYTLEYLQVKAYAAYYEFSVEGSHQVDNRIKETAYTNIGDEYLWHGKTLSSDHIDTLIVYDSLKTVKAPYCDSIHILTLYVIQGATHQYASICEGESYTWRTFNNTADTVCTTQGDYTFHTLSHFNTDSAVCLHLTVLPTFNTTDRDTVCDYMLPYMWDSRKLETEGEYQYTYTSQNGCDSTVTFTLTVLHSTTKNMRDTICKGDTLEWCGDKLYEAGHYERHLVNAAGCDSLLTMDLVVNKPVHIELSRAVCEGGAYEFSDTTVNTPATYVRHYTGYQGCDSIITLHFSVLSFAQTDTFATICDNELPFYWHGHELTGEGEVQDQLTSSTGCDSIVTLHLTVNKATQAQREETICQGEKYYFFGTPLTEENYYTQIVTNTANCDSTITLHLKVAQPSLNAMSQTICKGEQLPWCDTTLTTAGHYEKHYVNHMGCDSLVTMDLVVNKPSAYAFSVKVCEGESFMFDDEKITQADVYTHHYTNAAGCDSTATLTFTIGEATEIEVADNFCEGGQYLFADEPITSAGVYTHIFQREGKCDSTVTLTLTMLPAPVVYTDKTITEGETYRFGNRDLTKADTYRDTTYETGTHCMLIEELTLTVIPRTEPILIEERDTVCEADLPYQWTGHTGYDNITDNGVYEDFSDPDTHYSLTLVVLRATESNEEATVSSIEHYHWLGHDGYEDILTSGIYHDTAYYANGCDSIIYTLNIQMFDPEVVMDAYIDEACANDKDWAITFHIAEGKPARCDLYFDAAARKAGFRDTIGMHFPDDISSPVVFTIPMPANDDSTLYVRPDIYPVMVHIEDIFNHSLDTTLHFSVFYPQWVILQRWNDVLLVQNATYNGGYDFSKIQWYHDGETMQAQGEHNGYVYEPLQIGDPYWAELTRIDDGKTMRTCYYYPIEMVDDTEVNLYLSLAAQNKNEYRHISIRTNTSGQYYVYGVDGKQVAKGQYGDRYSNLQINLPSSVPTGTYILHFTSEEGKTFTKKWTVL